MLFPGHAREFLLGGLVAACGALAATVSGPVSRTSLAHRAPSATGVASAPASVSHRVPLEAFGATPGAPAVPEEVGARSRAPVSDAALARRLAARVREDPEAWNDLVAVLRDADRFAPDDAHGLSVPEVALRLLARRAHDREDARRALEELVWGERRIPRDALRRRAASALVPLARGPELERLARSLEREQDQALVAAARAALSSHPEPERVLALFGDLPRATPEEER